MTLPMKEGGETHYIGWKVAVVCGTGGHAANKLQKSCILLLNFSIYKNSLFFSFGVLSERGDSVTILGHTAQQPNNSLA